MNSQETDLLVHRGAQSVLSKYSCLSYLNIVFGFKNELLLHLDLGKHESHSMLLTAQTGAGFSRVLVLKVHVSVSLLFQEVTA